MTNHVELIIGSVDSVEEPASQVAAHPVLEKATATQADPHPVAPLTLIAAEQLQPAQPAQTPPDQLAQPISAQSAAASPANQEGQAPPPAPKSTLGSVFSRLSNSIRTTAFKPSLVSISNKLNIPPETKEWVTSFLQENVRSVVDSLAEKTLEEYPRSAPGLTVLQRVIMSACSGESSPGESERHSPEKGVGKNAREIGEMAGHGGH